MVVNSQAPAAGRGSDTGAVAARRPNDDKLSADERYSESAAPMSMWRTRGCDLSRTAPQAGDPRILEPRSTDLPGFVRAVVSRDVRGFDGTTVLIPATSWWAGIAAAWR